MKSSVVCQYVITIRVSDVFGVFSADGDQHRCGPGHPGRPLHHQDQPDHAQAREEETSHVTEVLQVRHTEFSFHFLTSRINKFTKKMFLAELLHRNHSPENIVTH